MIIRGGENIASAEVEYVVSQDERMACVAAVAVPDDVMGELVGIAVELAPGQVVSPQEIIDFADARLRYPARPVICVIFDELRKSPLANTTDFSARRDKQGAQERREEGRHRGLGEAGAHEGRHGQGETLESHQKYIKREEERLHSSIRAEPRTAYSQQ